MEEFILEKKIYYHDTDCGGVVYYANYLKHLEEARTEFLSSKGINLKKLAEEGMWFAVAKVEIEYKAPAGYQDTIRIMTAIESSRKTAMQFRQRIFRDDKLLVEAGTVLVCVGKNFKPMAIPDVIKKGLSL